MHNHNNNYQPQCQQSQCPQCGNRYSSSSGSQQSQSSASQQRILIPIHKDLLQQKGSSEGIQQILQNLQRQVQSLKAKNQQKDKVIDDMRRQMENKIAHYALYGQINRQNEEIYRLRNQVYQNNNLNNNYRSHIKCDSQGDQPLRNKKSGFNSVNIEYGLPSHKNIQRKFRENESYQSFDNDINLKSAYNMGNFPSKTSLLDGYYKKTQTIPLKRRIKTDRSNFLEKNQRFSIQKPKNVFKIGQTKRKLQQLQNLVKVYEEQFIWMKNFINTFIHTLEKVAAKKHNQKIFVEKWGLKKKVKSCWRYFKHLLTYLYQQ